MQFIKRMVSLSASVSESLSKLIHDMWLCCTTGDFASTWQVEDGQQSLSGKGGHQFERFSTHPSLKDNALGILRGVFEILISSFIAGLSKSRQEWLRQCTLERPEMHG